MRSVKVLPTLADVCRASDDRRDLRDRCDRWYVTNGVSPVGPVSFELLLRGIEAGKVPAGSFIRHEAWKVWRPLAEVAVVTDDVASVTSVTSVASLASLASAVSREADAPLSTLFDSSDDVTAPGCPKDMTPSPLEPSPSPSEAALTLEEPLSGNLQAQFSSS